MVQSIPVSCVNEVMSCRANVLEPKVGMLGTYFVGSDRYAVVVCKVYSPKKIFVQDIPGYDEADIPKDIIDGVQFWKGSTEALMEKNCPKYHSEYGDDSASIFAYDNARFWKEGTYTLRKNGRWVEQGRGLWECGSIHLGVADPYRDPSF